MRDGRTMFDAATEGREVRAATGSPDDLSDGTLTVLAAVAAATVANGYYVQPLLVQIGVAVDLPAGLVGLLPALTQVGLGIGLVTLLPLADSLSASRVLIATLPLQAAALLAVAATRLAR